jgi:anti-sigma factor RsiW
MQCEQIADVLPQIVDGTTTADRAVLRHVDACLRCQAELVQYRKLLKTLRTLRTEVLEPAPGTLTGIFARLEEAGERRAVRSLLTGRRAAYVGGIAAAATAAGAAGALVLAHRAKTRSMRIAS